MKGLEQEAIHNIRTEYEEYSMEAWTEEMRDANLSPYSISIPDTFMNDKEESIAWARNFYYKNEYDCIEVIDSKGRPCYNIDSEGEEYY